MLCIPLPFPPPLPSTPHPSSPSLLITSLSDIYCKSKSFRLSESTRQKEKVLEKKCVRPPDVRQTRRATALFSLSHSPCPTPPHPTPPPPNKEGRQQPFQLAMKDKNTTHQTHTRPSHPLAAPLTYYCRPPPHLCCSSKQIRIWNLWKPNSKEKNKEKNRETREGCKNRRLLRRFDIQSVQYTHPSKHPTTVRNCRFVPCPLTRPSPTASLTHSLTPTPTPTPSCIFCPFTLLHMTKIPFTSPPPQSGTAARVLLTSLLPPPTPPPTHPSPIQLFSRLPSLAISNKKTTTTGYEQTPKHPPPFFPRYFYSLLTRGPRLGPASIGGCVGVLFVPSHAATSTTPLSLSPPLPSPNLTPLFFIAFYSLLHSFFFFVPLPHSIPFPNRQSFKPSTPPPPSSPPTHPPTPLPIFDHLSLQKKCPYRPPTDLLGYFFGWKKLQD